MKFVTAFHHAANWFFFPVWDKQFDTGNPEYSGLYGIPHKQDAMRNQEFQDEWYGKIIEVIEKYSPDFIWFDFALDAIAEGYVKDMLAYYYNHAAKANKEVVVTYKGHDLVPGAGIRDSELGQEPNLTYNEWITDNSVDDRGAWGLAEDLTFKTPNRLIDNLVDRVSKNGYLLLNVGPKPDGTIQEEAKEVLLAMRAWLETNGEAIYNTTPWMVAGEGPTNIGEADELGFNESDIVYTSNDVRFTVNGDNLYATFLDWPGEKSVIKTIRSSEPGFGQEDLPSWASEKITHSLAGTSWDILDEEEEEVVEYHFEFIDDHKFRISGGDAGEGMDGVYRQSGTDVFLTVTGFDFMGKYDHEALKFYL